MLRTIRHGYDGTFALDSWAAAPGTIRVGDDVELVELDPRRRGPGRAGGSSGRRTSWRDLLVGPDFLSGPVSYQAPSSPRKRRISPASRAGWSSGTSV